MPMRSSRNFKAQGSIQARLGVTPPLTTQSPTKVSRGSPGTPKSPAASTGMAGETREGNRGFTDCEASGQVLQESTPPSRKKKNKIATPEPPAGPPLGALPGAQGFWRMVHKWNGDGACGQRRRGGAAHARGGMGGCRVSPPLVYPASPFPRPISAHPVARPG